VSRQANTNAVTISSIASTLHLQSDPSTQPNPTRGLTQLMNASGFLSSALIRQTECECRCRSQQLFERFRFYVETMSRSSCNPGVERNHQTTAGSVLSVLDAQRKQRGLRKWVRGLDRISEGAHVWPASALLTLGTLIMTVVWLCQMSTDGSSSLYLALKVETDLHDVITTLKHERRCATATCRTSSPVRYRIPLTQTYL